VADEKNPQLENQSLSIFFFGDAKDVCMKKGSKVKEHEK
jgi:hypothetical protein